MQEKPVRVRVPASSANLGPGFDSLALALDIYNEVELSESASGRDEISAEGEGAQLVPRDESNIALQAARALLQHLDAPPIALRLHLKNAIPLARGLGSSSAARCGALFAANELARQCGWKSLEMHRLVSLAAKLEGHPDNTSAALIGGLVASAQMHFGAERETLTIAVRAPIPTFPQFAVFIPNAPVETAKARAVLPQTVSREDAVFNVSHASLLLCVLMTGDFGLLMNALRDRLHESHRAPLMPGFAQARKAVVGPGLGAYATTLSGAGPTVLAWVRPDADAQACADAMREAAAHDGVAGRAQVVRPDLNGCVLL